jgi:hypothetical protein
MRYLLLGATLLVSYAIPVLLLLRRRKVDASRRLRDGRDESGDSDSK